jgi:sulfur carrier protein ThiS
MKASFSFDPTLSLFLDPAKRGNRFDYDCARAATLKNAIEALGVPHTEVGALRVNGEPATLQRIVREGDRVEIDAWKSGSDPDLRFVADAHLGGLARFLRMLGFDTLHRNAFSDDEIRRLAEAESRIVLTRDRELLKCREILRGAYVRALKPEAQLREVAGRYALAAFARPFTLCLGCNLPLQEV